MYLGLSLHMMPPLRSTWSSLFLPGVLLDVLWNGNWLSDRSDCAYVKVLSVNTLWISVHYATLNQIHSNRAIDSLRIHAIFCQWNRFFFGLFLLGLLKSSAIVFLVASEDLNLRYHWSMDQAHPKVAMTQEHSYLKRAQSVRISISSWHQGLCFRHTDFQVSNLRDGRWCVLVEYSVLLALI